MATFAVIKDNAVINIIVADTKEIAEEATGFECVEYTSEDEVHIDDIWDGTSFSKPVIEAPAVDTPVVE